MNSHRIVRMSSAGAVLVAAFLAGPALPVHAQVDSDGDGIYDSQEASLGTDPQVADTDGDGLIDGVELALGLDPLAIDSDGDGVSDPSEYLAGSDPLDPASTPGGFGGSADSVPVTVSPPPDDPAPDALAFSDETEAEQRTAAWLFLAVAMIGFAVLAYSAIERPAAAEVRAGRRPEEARPDRHRIGSSTDSVDGQPGVGP